MVDIGDHDLGIVTRIVLFFSSLSFLAILFQTAFGVVVISVLNLALLSTTSVAVAGACMISTGLACAIALGLSTILNGLASGLLTALGIDVSTVPILSNLLPTSEYAWLSSLILIPTSIILQIFIAKLARGQ